MTDRPDLCPTCQSIDPPDREHPNGWHCPNDAWHDGPSTADRPDLAALADRLDRRADELESLGGPFDPTPDRTAARTLRAVAAAPGPLRPRKLDYGEPGPWEEWLHALADAVGEL